MTTETKEVAIYPVTGMTCASCAASVGRILNKTTGVAEAHVNYANEEVQISFDTSLTYPLQLQEAVRSIGYDLLLDADEEDKEAIQKEKYEQVKKNTLGAAILTIPVFIIGMFFMDWELGRWISLILSIPVLFYFGKHFYINAFKQAKNGISNMDTLVALSTGIAFGFSVFNTLYPQFWTSQGLEPHVYFEAATVIIVFVSLGKWIEERAKSNTSSAIQKLMGLQPKEVTILLEGEEQTISIEELKTGQIVIVYPGQKIPVDGEIIKGTSFIDESMMTGEPIAVEKKRGSKVYAGTQNQNGNFQLMAMGVGKQTYLSKIIETVKLAQGSKAPIQNLVDKIASIFVPTVLVIALATFGVWLYFGTFSQALLTSVSVLVIACPCALGLATPTAIMVGIGKGADNNILIKDAESLQNLSQVTDIVLDKTGTITKGEPSVTSIKWEDENEAFKKVLLALQQRSKHPLAGAIVKHLKNLGIRPSPVKDFEELSGLGVSGKSLDGTLFFCGNLRLAKKVLGDDVLSRFSASFSSQTNALFFSETTLIAKLQIEDEIKPTSEVAIQNLKAENLVIHMLTGDSFSAAKSIADKVHIEHVQAEKLPSEKADFIKHLQGHNHKVAMIGDGINDAEALALSDVSIAMGKGSDIAMDVAQITLTTSDLASVPKAIKLSRMTMTTLKQNLFWAFVYNLIGIPIAAGVLYPLTGFLLNPMIAGAAMALSSISVVGNSLLLQTKKL